MILKVTLFSGFMFNLPDQKVKSVLKLILPPPLKLMAKCNSLSFITS